MRFVHAAGALSVCVLQTPTPAPAGGCLGDPIAYARIVSRLFFLQAVVKSEAKPFAEARNYLPALKAATRWAAIEQSWGYARALASELSCWRRDSGTGGALSTAGGASAVAVGGGGSPAPQAGTGAAEDQDGAGVYCVCRGEDYGAVMVECDACSEWYHASW